MNNEYENKYRGDSVWTDSVEFCLPGGFRYKGTVRAQILTVFIMGGSFLGLYAGVKAINRHDARKRKGQNLSPELKELMSKIFKQLREDTQRILQQAPQPQERPDALKAETPRPQTIIHPGATALIAGFTNTGKSILALQTAAAAAGGKGYLTLPGKPPLTAGEQKVLYISTEDNIPQPRVDAVRAALGDNRVNFEFRPYQPPASEQEKGTDDFVPLYNLLEGWVQQQRGDCMVFIDNLSVFRSMAVETYVKGFNTKVDELSFPDFTRHFFVL